MRKYGESQKKKVGESQKKNAFTWSEEASQESDHCFAAFCDLITKSTKSTLTVLFRTVSLDARVPIGGPRVPLGRFSEGSEKARECSEKVRRRLEKVREGMRRSEQYFCFTKFELLQIETRHRVEGAPQASRNWRVVHWTGTSPSPEQPSCLAPTRKETTVHSPQPTGHDLSAR